MDLIAATATDPNNNARGFLILACLALTWAAGYALACWWWPFKGCLKCEGVGRFKSPSGRAWRKCPRCAGSGTRVRLGRRVLNAWRKATKAA